MNTKTLKTRVADRSDQEFLPAALEILETPPSPVHATFVLVICAFVVVALTWAYFSRIDVIASAQGKIQPTGRVKMVQPVETGKVAVLHVSNGKHVKQNDILVELDPGEARAEEIGFAAEFDSALAEVARRKVALDVGRSQALSSVPAIPWKDNTPAAIRIREERVLSGDLAQLAANVTSLVAQKKQKQAERDRLRSTMKMQEELIATLQERIQMRETLVQRGAGPRANLIDALETLQYQKTILATEIGQEKESEANLEVLADEIARNYENFVADNGQKLAEAEKHADDAEQKLAKARVRTGHMTLASPIDGTVQALSITTLGQVITTGEQIMRLVPDSSVLEIECYLPNKDVGFVKPGQSAIVKIESFPFTRYGSLAATVSKVAHDAIPEPDAQQIEGDPSRSTKSTAFAGTERVQNLVFSVTLEPTSTEMNVDGVAVPLSPGMAVSVEIKTDSRRILEYVFSPLIEVASKAMKER
jgi:hemolysin D